MPDYQCWCLWDMIVPRNVNPDTMSISEELKVRLHSWEECFDKTLDLSDHENIGFKNEQEYVSFYDAGWELFESLRSELPDIEWWYLDGRHAGLLDTKPPGS